MHNGILELAKIDTKDDRNEIFYLLSKLTSDERISFVELTINEINTAVKLTHRPPYVLIKVENITGTINENYADLMFAIAQYRIDPQIVLNALEKLVALKTKNSIDSKIRKNGNVTIDMVGISR